MDLEVAFADIPDDTVLGTPKHEDTALARLLKAYGKCSKRIDRLPDMDDASTGRDLKNGIAKMAPEDQVRLAYRYYVDQGILEPEFEDPEEKSNRLLHHWTVKALVIMFAGLFLLLSGAVLAYTWHKGGVAPDDKVVGGLLQLAAEIAKILLSSGD